MMTWLISAMFQSRHNILCRIAPVPTCTKSNHWGNVILLLHSGLCRQCTNYLPISCNQSNFIARVSGKCHNWRAIPLASLPTLCLERGDNAIGCTEPVADETRFKDKCLALSVISSCAIATSVDSVGNWH